MLPLRQLIPLLFLFGSVPLPSAQQTTRVNRDPITARASILQQIYCRGDADLFTVSLKLKLEAVNSSKTPVYLLWPMIPWVGKVAGSAVDAEAKLFLYEMTASHYPQDVTRFHRLKIEPGKKVTVETGYDLIARHDPAFSYPKSLSAGTYTLVLVLGPEEEPPTQMQGPNTLKSITTEPLVVEVPADPELVSCEAGAKAQ
jgi:hypothetical protein